MAPQHRDLSNDHPYIALPLRLEAPHYHRSGRLHPVIAVEGIMGAGKTTLLRKLKQESIFNVVEENVRDWSYFSDYCREPDKFAYELQKQVLMSYILPQKHKIRPDKINIIERSIYSFDGFLNHAVESEYISYTEEADLIRWANQGLPVLPDLIIYLHCDPEVGHRRILNRNRAGESIDIDYLSEVGDWHNSYFGRKYWVEQFLGTRLIPSHNRLKEELTWRALYPEIMVRQTTPIITIDSSVHENAVFSMAKKIIHQFCRARMVTTRYRMHVSLNIPPPKEESWGSTLANLKNRVAVASRPKTKNPICPSWAKEFTRKTPAVGRGAIRGSTILNKSLILL